MKTRNKTTLMALLCAAFAFTQAAQAFYDANLGRWVNRDPLGDTAFLTLHTHGKSRNEQAHLRAEALKPLYVFVGNTPTGSYDPFGLLQATGIRICREPGLGGHEWVEYDGGSVGFYPGPDGIWPGGTGTILSPDPHASDSDKKCGQVHVGDCIDVGCFEKCAKNLKNATPGWYCVIGDNCRDWVTANLNDCIKKCRKGAK